LALAPAPNRNENEEWRIEKLHSQFSILNSQFKETYVSHSSRNT
jgi:hypothetical protein